MAGDKDGEQTQNTVILEARGLAQIFGAGDSEVRAVDGVDLEVRRGEIVLIMGPSGSGKTTLLTMLGGLLKPTSGTVRINGHEITSMKESKLPDVRRRLVGFIFQSFNLLESLNVAENVEVVLNLAARWAQLVVEQLVRDVRAEEILKPFAPHLPGIPEQRGVALRAGDLRQHLVRGKMGEALRLRFPPREESQGAPSRSVARGQHHRGGEARSLVGEGVLFQRDAESLQGGGFRAARRACQHNHPREVALAGRARLKMAHEHRDAAVHPVHRALLPRGNLVREEQVPYCTPAACLVHQLLGAEGQHRVAHVLPRRAHVGRGVRPDERHVLLEASLPVLAEFAGHLLKQEAPPVPSPSRSSRHRR